MQKVTTDKRTEWWKRTSWCLENLNSDLKYVAKEMLFYHITESKLITDEEKTAIEKSLAKSTIRYFINRETKMNADNNETPIPDGIGDLLLEVHERCQSYFNSLKLPWWKRILGKKKYY